MYLFFDTETTGLPKNWSAPISNLANWPRMVQIAWILCDERGSKIEQCSHIIKPVGFTIPEAVVKVHGISQAKALTEGVLLKKVLDDFAKVLGKSTTLVAHNLSFDEKIVGAEFLREEMENKFSSISKICTKEISTDYCKLPSKYGYKWPTLEELYFALFNKKLKDAHDALADVKACRESFFELQNKGVIERTLPI